MVALPIASPELVTAEPPQSRVGGDAFQRTPQVGIGGGLEALGQGADELATSLAKAAGTEAGKQAVTLDANGQPQVATSLTSPILLGRAGPAYERAVSDSVDPGLRLSVSQTTTQMRQEHDLNPDSTPQTWAKNVGEFAQSLRAKYPGEIGERAFNLALAQGNQHLTNIVDQETKADLAQKQSVIQTDLTNNENKLLTLARQGGTGTPDFNATAELYNQGWQKLKDNAEMFNLVPAKVEQQERDSRIKLYGQGVIGSIDRIARDTGPNGGIAAAERVAKAIDSDATFQTLDRGAQEQIKAQAEARVQFNREENKQEINQTTAAIKGMVNEGYLKGQPPPDAIYQQVYSAAMRQGNFEAAAELDNQRKAFEARRATSALGTVPATGLGSFNQVYRGDPNQPGPNGGPSAAGLYSYYISKGASRNEAVLLTGAAASESGLNPAATHDPDPNGNPTGYGMFGHRLERRDAMFSDAGTRAPNWQQQADFALKELRSRPEGATVNSATTPEQLAAAQMHFEKPQGYRPEAPNEGLNYTGRLNTIRRFSSLDGSAPIPEVTPQGAIPFTPEQTKQNPGLIAAAYRQYAADIPAQVQAARDKASNAEVMMRNGNPPTVAQMAELRQAAMQFPAELGNKVRDITNDWAGRVAGAGDAQLPEPQRQARLAAVEQYARDNPDIAFSRRAKAYSEQSNADAKRKEEEPQRYAAEKEWRAPVQPLTPGDPQAFAAQISDRVAAARGFGERIGKAPEAVTFGTQDKADIASFLQSAPGPQARDALQRLIGGLDTPTANELFNNKDSEISKAVIGMSKSNDPDKIDAGFAAMDAQQRRNPAQFREQFPKEDARLHDYQTRLGYYSKDEIAKQNLKQNDPAQATAIAAKEKLADEKTANWTAEDVAKQFGTGITSYIPGLRALTGALPGTPPEFESAKGAFLADFRTLYRDGFVISGDHSQALDYAKERLPNKFSASEVNGNRVMAFAPEKTYQPINGSHDWIRGQLGEFVQKNVVPSAGSMGMPLPTPMGFDIPAGLPGEAATTYFPRTTAEQTAYAKVYAPRMLFSDADTQADIAAGRPPSYAVIAADPNGRTVPLTDTALKPLRFTPDYQRALGEWNAVQVGRHPAAQRGNAAATEAAADPMRGGG